MPSGLDAYSRLIAMLKVVLPMGALAMMATLFLFARSNTPPEEIPYSDINQIAQDPRISQPRFSGVAGDGSTLSVIADELRPLPGSEGEAFGSNLRMLRPEGDAILPGGRTVSLVAGEGTYASLPQIAYFGGLVHIQSGDGLHMETSGMTIDMPAATLETDGAMEARSPFGQLTAGHMIATSGNAQNGVQMVFSGGVRLLYLPQGTRPGEDAPTTEGSTE
ncbi:hypothetical protein [Ketogulonicigenium vulgare]|uniref:Lipopolysaccharide export system protein LptC n=1 Tax=Ketogulonicigenium vulgare (strain WSH-001) TaxID=759362 RepID=F9Y5V1_KETVW|nr:hypothetical protein [Ketogulonicigenium vulgare]ADO43761.1 conserved hypothetical protein [Ketogulonicigenium vulgare Y25]AEM42026.1 hypothetical protein KVU_2187 [Ketogulonicigenium vulgare WSH-001]ALJ82121.1 hypothetical protein KVH_13685 [Ketogulonicigenium vulgare]ANW34744.1 hypothetical protein KvSKV_13595 [Ketogulonicigenium vulgare]AOZ55794.1 hypothetical protein KVC_2792 [Ketogulonicigenium vulgare]